MPVFNVQDAKGGSIPLALVLNTDGSYSLSVAIDQDVTIPSSVSIPDGNDVVEGHLADAANGVDAAGTLSAKLRQLTKQLPAALVNGQLPVALYDSLGNALITVVPTDGDAVGRRLAVSALSRALRSTDVTKIDSILADINALRVSLAAKSVAAGDKLILADAAGNLMVSLGTKIAGEDLTNDRLGTYLKPADSDSVLETLQNAATATGNGTSINLRGYKSATVEVAGTFVGTVTFEVRIDTNWYVMLMTKVTDGTTASTATAAGLFTTPATNLSLQDFRARISAYTSGAITVESRKHPR